MSSKKKSSSEQNENSNDAPQTPYEQILACRSNPPRPPEYLVKLREKSYQNSKWISTEDLQKNPISQSMLTRFIKNQRDYPIDPPYYDPQYDKIDRIICKKDRKYFVKWMGLGYDQATWEKTVSDEALEDFNLRQKQIHPPKSGDIHKQPSLNFQRLSSYKFNNNELESYQLATMNLLLNNYSKMKNTDIVDRYNSQLHIPCAAFFEYILQNSLNKENSQTSTTRARRTRSQKIDSNETLESENGGEFGPVLIVAPLPSTIKWYNAFRSIQNATTINYTGKKEGRQVAVETDFYHNEDNLKFHVLVTTPDILSNNMKTLSEIKWRIAIFDDANRLKNPKSKLAKELQHFAIGLQIALMQSQPNYSALKKLTDLLIENCTNPYIDEEVKKVAQDVRSQIQPKVLKKKSQSAFDDEKESFATYYVDCPLSETQRKILKEVIRESGRYVQKKNFIPLCRRILRICSHPFLLYSKEFYLNGVDFISSSTKLETLQHLLSDECSNPNNRILIMSDFSLMLDMIEDVANVYEISNERILSQSKEVLHEDANVFLYNPKYCSISPSLFKTMNTIIVFDGQGTELKELLQTNTPPNLHKIYKLHCRDCSEETLTRICILNNVNTDEVQPGQCESICKLAALAAYSDKPVPDAKSIIKKATVIMNSFNPNDILEKEFNSCDFWSYLVDEEKSSKSQLEYEKEDTLIDNIEDESEPHMWTIRERDQVLRGLCRFGFNRWKKMRIQTGLKVNVKKVFNASRALVREILGSNSGHASTREFLKESSMKEDDETNDKSFINNSCFNNQVFKKDLSTNYASYLKEIESIDFLAKTADEKDVYEISVPHPAGPLPKWWIDTYDQYLVYGTCKYGLGCYDQFVEDTNQDILKIFGPSDDPINQKDLTDRCLKLVETIKRKQSSGQRNEGSEKSNNKKDNAAYQPPNSGQNYSDSEFSSSSSAQSNSINNSSSNSVNSSSSSYTISSRRKAESSHSYDDSNYGSEPRTRMKKELKSDIYQYLIRWGVPEDEKGKPDYETFANESGLSRYLAVDEVKDLVEDYLNKCNISPSEGGNPPNTSNKINQRCLAMKRLREIMRNEELAKKVFENTPHWRQLPKEWTPEIEYLYFRTILQDKNYGLINDKYENILKGSEFGDIHDKNPPPFIYDTSKVMKRIEVIYNSMLEGIKDGKFSKTANIPTQSTSNSAKSNKKATTQSIKNANRPTAPSSSSSSKKVKKIPIPNGYTLQSNRSLFPADRAIFDGRVVYPLNLGDGQIILNLGIIIPEREDYHTDRYIFPKGYKVSNRLPSVLEKDTNTQWINEICVENGENEELPPSPNPLDQSNKLVFKAWMEDNPLKVYKGPTANAVWSEISNEINELNGGGKGTISGIDAFLLSNQAVAYLIQKMKGSKRCHNYKAKEVVLPPFAQRLREWKQTSGVPFSQAALNEPNIKAAKPKPVKKKQTKKKVDVEDDDDDQAFIDDGTENGDDVEEEEEEEAEEETETEEEEEEDFDEDDEEEEKKDNKKKKQTKTTAQKKSSSTTKEQPKNSSQKTTTQQQPSKKSYKKESKQNIQQQQQQQIQMKPLQLNQISGSVIQNQMMQKVPPQFTMQPQNQMMQGFMPYNKPGMMTNNPMMTPNMMQQNLIQNPQQAKNLPPNFFMQNNVQNNLPQSFIQQPGFIQAPPMQNFIQNPGVIQPNNLMKNGNQNQLPIPPPPPPPDQNSHQVKQESNFNDSNPVNNQ